MFDDHGEVALCFDSWRVNSDLKPLRTLLSQCPIKKGPNFTLIPLLYFKSKVDSYKSPIALNESITPLTASADWLRSAFSSSFN